MKKFIATVLMLGTACVFSQTNLVLNPTLENYSGCPTQVGELDKANFWNTFSGSCDYFKPCATDPGSSVPSNAFGYQFAHSGNSYAGFIAYYDAVNYKEVMGVKLQGPLTVSQKYFFSFFISRGTKLCGYGVNKIGVKFTQTDSYTATAATNMGQLVNNTAHYSSNMVISDTLNWVNITGSFVADSAYKFLMIGNFYDNSNITIVSLPPGGGNYAYYYIDDVCLSTDSAFVTEYAVGLQRTKNDLGKISIFPNPADRLVSLVCPLNSTLSITNAFGEPVQISPTLNARGYSFSTEFLRPGVYYLHVNDRVEKLVIYH